MNTMFLTSYVKDIFARFGMEQSKAKLTPLDGNQKLKLDVASFEDGKISYQNLLGPQWYLFPQDQI